MNICCKYILLVQYNAGPLPFQVLTTLLDKYSTCGILEEIQDNNLDPKPQKDNFPLGLHMPEQNRWAYHRDHLVLDFVSRYNNNTFSRYWAAISFADMVS